jgi:AraC-like DNA-binding protein
MKFKTQIIQAYEWLKQLVDEGLADISFFINRQSMGKFDHFTQGRWVFCFGWPWEMYFKRYDIIKDIHYSELPQGPCWGHQPFITKLASSGWCISKNTEYKEEAVNALKKILTYPAIKEAEIIGGQIFPAYMKLWSDKDVLKAKPFYRFAETLINDYPPYPFDPFTRLGFHLERTFRESFETGLTGSEWMEQFSSQTVPDLPEKDVHPSIKDAVEFIFRNLNRVTQVQKVARSVNLNINTFRILFKQEMGLSCKEFIIKQKMEQAKEMATQKGSSAKQIAFKLGFKDPNYFSRTFKKYWGFPISKILLNSADL